MCVPMSVELSVGEQAATQSDGRVVNLWLGGLGSKQYASDIQYALGSSFFASFIAILVEAGITGLSRASARRSVLGWFG